MYDEPAARPPADWPLAACGRGKGMAGISNLLQPPGALGRRQSRRHAGAHRCSSRPTPGACARPAAQQHAAPSAGCMIDCPSPAAPCPALHAPPIGPARRAGRGEPRPQGALHCALRRRQGHGGGGGPPKRRLAARDSAAGGGRRRGARGDDDDASCGGGGGGGGGWSPGGGSCVGPGPRPTVQPGPCSPGPEPPEQPRRSGKGVQAGQPLCRRRQHLPLVRRSRQPHQLRRRQQQRQHGHTQRLRQPAGRRRRQCKRRRRHSMRLGRAGGRRGRVRP